jgi:NTP pyrophosphatase (non-canonical NTP hydrolase)
MKELIKKIHQQNVNAGWWSNLETGESLTSKNGEKAKRNIPEMLCLIHSEISEAMEGHRKNLMDDKLPHRSMLEVELADAVIRICDMAGGLDLDLYGAIIEKLEYNKSRADHKIENRLTENGKKF